MSAQAKRPGQERICFSSLENSLKACVARERKTGRRVAQGKYREIRRLNHGLDRKETGFFERH